MFNGNRHYLPKNMTDYVIFKFETVVHEMGCSANCGARFETHNSIFCTTEKQEYYILLKKINNYYIKIIILHIYLKNWQYWKSVVQMCTFFSGKYF